MVHIQGNLDIYNMLSMNSASSRETLFLHRYYPQQSDCTDYSDIVLRTVGTFIIYGYGDVDNTML